MIRRAMWGVLPVKPFAAAKHRLSAILTPADRAALARAMFEDVLDTLVRCRALDGVVVVTADTDAATIALAAGAYVLDESVPAGLNSALRDAIALLGNPTGGGIVVVPSDIPQLSPEAVEYAVDAVSADAAVALQRASDGGTNLLACRPAGIIIPHFGPGSFHAHCAAAQRLNLMPRIIEWPALELDLDRPDDLRTFLSLQTATRAHTCVAQALSLGMISRAIVSI